MKRINFVTLTAPVAMISDQLTFLREAVSNFEIPCSASSNLDPSALNVVIEGFTPFSARYVREFCDTRQKKISLVITEHLDVKDEVIINDVLLSRANEYMPNASERLRNLCQVLPHVRFIWVLGHLPKASNIKKLFPQTPIVHVPYPPIRSTVSFLPANRRFELSFTGTVTQYRNKILTNIKRFFKCCYTFSDSTDSRQRIISDSLFTLQIPQHEAWRYVSPMRILFALRAGTPILNISSFSDELFDPFIPRIQPSEVLSEISRILRTSPAEVLAKSVASYNQLAADSMKSSKMPYSIRIWQDLES